MEPEQPPEAGYSILQDDSSGSGPFEGPEKLLELWFAPSAEDVAECGEGERTSIEGVVEGSGAGEKLKGLRRVRRETWEGMLDLVRCKVLSVIEGPDVDAYLLSESSMFVWPHKLILKTCGTTTLLLGLRSLLSIAAEKCGLPGVWRCFYSRKTFMFPERQLGPHKAWSEEVHFLDAIFDKGSAYTVGKMNGDHWLLYMTAPRADVLASNRPPAPASGLSSPSSSVVLPSKGSTGKANGLSLKDLLPPLLHRPSSTPSTAPTPTSPFATEPDSTLEILMSGLSPGACSSFYCGTASSSSPSNASPIRYPDEPPLDDGHGPGKVLAGRLGLDDPDLFGEDVCCDAFLFSPCGFSANMVSKGQEGGARYATVHVTPEQGWSYASFECNIDFSGVKGKAAAGQGHGGAGAERADLKALVGRVVKMFGPKRFSLTLFVSREEGMREDHEDDRGDDRDGPDGQDEGAADVEEAIHEGFRTVLSRDLVKGYRRTDRIVYEFDGYDLVFATFDRRASR